MPPQQPMIGTDAANSFEDLSGLIPKSAKASVPENPYDVLIEACNNDPVSASSHPYTTRSLPLTVKQGPNPGSILDAPHHAE